MDRGSKVGEGFEVKHKLNVKAVQAAKGPKWFSDGGGLYLKVTKGGGKSWVFRWRDRDTSKLRDMGIGPYPDYTLAEARDTASICRRLVIAGLDPIEERDRERAEQAAEMAAASKVMTFSKAAKAYIDAKVEPESKSDKHVAQWRSSLEQYAYPVLGKMDVADIDVPHVMKVLSPIWSVKSETASRVRLRTEHVLNWAAVQGYRDRFNPAQWRGVLSHLLPAKEKIAPGVHHKALHYSEVPAFLTRLRKKGGMGAKALEFAILCASRSGEVRGAKWSEFDLSARVWKIPKGRMKAKREHKVPLTDAAVALLEALPESDNALVFPAARGGQLSDMTLNKICRDMEVEAVPHGFRSSFKDWCREKADMRKDKSKEEDRIPYPDELSELALAHVNSDATRAAYARSDLLDLRRDLMRDWAAYCNQTGGKVVPIKGAA